MAMAAGPRHMGNAMYSQDGGPSRGIGTAQRVDEVAALHEAFSRRFRELEALMQSPDSREQEWARAQYGQANQQYQRFLEGRDAAAASGGHPYREDRRAPYRPAG